MYDRGIARIAIQWVPTHCGITKNEFADARAKTLLSNCSLLLQSPEKSDRSQIRANLRIEDKFPKAQQSTLAQLRTGTCNSMGWWYGPVLGTVGTDMTATTKMMMYADGAVKLLKLFYMCLTTAPIYRSSYSTVLLRGEWYREATVHYYTLHSHPPSVQSERQYGCPRFPRISCQTTSAR